MMAHYFWRRYNEQGEGRRKKQLKYAIIRQCEFWFGVIVFYILIGKKKQKKCIMSRMSRISWICQSLVTQQQKKLGNSLRNRPASVNRRDG